jgi:hypothetical protein
VRKLCDFPWLSLRGNAIAIRFGLLAIQPQRFKLTVKGRAADTQPPCDFRHLSSVMCNCIPDKLGFDLLERPHLTRFVEERKRIEKRRGLRGDEALGGRGFNQNCLT